MNLKLRKIATGLVGAMLVAAGTLMAAPASIKSGKSMNEHGKAARLLRGIGWDANTVQRHAQRWEGLPNTAFTAWRSHDKQWNEIKPAVEGMDVRLKNLEAMRANLLPAQQEAIAKMRPLLLKIEENTHRLRILLDRDTARLSSSASRMCAAALARDARQIALAVPRG